MKHADITHSILGSAFDVLNELGSGFLEKVYENALCFDLRSKGLSVQQQTPVEVLYRSEPVGHYVADLLIEEVVLIELKAVKSLLPEHEAQTINYLKALNLPVGLLLNFGKPSLEYKRLYSKGPST